uniref:Uncharacterized protein n=1 Tax=Hirondellea gigas TaxID=1518452 RepID=A0A6A7G9X6_9CRUS
MESSSIDTNLPLVFIHGIKGSLLCRKSTKKLVFLKACQVFNINQTFLCSCDAEDDHFALPLKWNENDQRLNVQETDDIEAPKPIDTLKLFGFPIKTVYGPFLQFGEDSNRPFYPFAYDWRRENSEAVSKFAEFVRSIHDKHKSKVQIVAHSMGGMITMGLLHDHSDLIHSILFAGTPFGAGVPYLEDLTNGSVLGLNTTLLSPSVLFSFPASFSFFPVSEQDAIDNNSSFKDPSGNHFYVDLYDSNEWIKHKLSIFGGPVSDTTVQYLQKALDSAKSFRERYMIFNKEIRYPPIAVLAGDAIPTKNYILLTRTDSETKLDFNILDKPPGDGRIIVPNCMPPKGIPHRAYTVCVPIFASLLLMRA